MSDIVERLENDVSLFSRLDWQEHVALAHEAAAEIERLRKERDEAVATLEWYAGPHAIPNEGPWGTASNDFGERARALLTRIKEAKGDE